MASLFKPEIKKSLTGTVQYKVCGSKGSYNLTYHDDDDKTCQLSEVQKKWSHFFESKTGNYAYVAAQSNVRKGRVVVRIYFRGKLVKKNSASGDYAIAKAGGYLF